MAGRKPIMRRGRRHLSRPRVIVSRENLAKDPIFLFVRSVVLPLPCQPHHPNSKKREPLPAENRAQGSSTSTSQNTNISNPRRLGSGTVDGEEDFKVIYEPPPAFSNLNNQSVGSFQDQDSRDLAERMEKMRKAQRIH